MTTESEIEVMGPQAKECLKPPNTGRHKGWILPESLWREDSPANMLISDLWPPELEENEFLSF